MFRWIAVFAAGCSCFAYADGPNVENVVAGTALQAPPKIDGKLDEGEWAGAALFEGQYDSANGEPAAERAEFWLAYDGDAVYFAAKLYDSQPRSIRLNEYRKNSGHMGDDSVTLFLDTFGTLSDFNKFSVNPRGATGLGIAGGRAAKTEWLGEFLAEGRLTDFGWEAEMRIPWKLLRLPSAGLRELRFNVVRYMARTQRSYSWQYAAGDRFDRTGRWTSVQIPRVPVDRTIKLLPYGYAGGGKGTHPIWNAGFDLKTPVTDQIEFVGSVNPDFRNIENQVLSLDFSYFERLAGESRPFFQEGAGYFRTGFDQKIYASQRIDRFDVGAKAYGKINERTTFVAQNTLDFGDQNAFVASGDHRINDRSNVDFAAAFLDEPGVRNQALKIGLGSKVGKWDAYFNSMFTNDRDTGSGWRNNVGLWREGDGMEQSLEFVEVTPKFNPRLGFSPEQDFRGFNSYTGWGWTHDKGLFGETGLDVWGSMYWRLDGRQYRRNLGVSTSLTQRDGLDIDTSWEISRFGVHDDWRVNLDIEKPRRDTYRNWSIEGTLGRFQGKAYRALGLSTNYRPIQRLQLSLGQQHAWHFDSMRQTIAGLNFEIGEDQSLGGRLVERDGDINAYLSYRRSGVRGIEYFVILGDPNSRQFETRLILKVVFPIELKL